MKKSMFITIMFLSFLYSLKAQKTIELNKQWNEITSGLFSSDFHTDIYSFRKDTSINSIEYLELFAKSDTLNSTKWESLNIFMREDSLNRIYILEFGVEKILYDFNLTVNDTFQLNVYFSECELLVYQIDSIQLLNGELRKRIRLIRSDDPNPNQPWYGYKDWIQGIGSTASLYKYIGSCFTDFSIKLLCYFENDEILYTRPNNQGCFFTPLKEIDVSFEYYVYPNPNHGEIHIKSNFEIDQINVLNLNGETLISAKETSINLSQLNSGIYIVQIITQKGNVSQKIIVE